jgi:hypothetical protein
MHQALLKNSLANCKIFGCNCGVFVTAGGGERTALRAEVENSHSTSETASPRRFAVCLLAGRYIALGRVCIDAYMARHVNP